MNSTDEDNQMLEAIGAGEAAQAKEAKEEHNIALYLKCREEIKRLRRQVGECFLDIGKYCCLVADNELWKYEDGINSMDQWIKDPDFGPGIGRRNVYNFMKLYRFSIFLLNKFGIDITIFLEIGVKKLLYLIPYIEQYIKTKDKGMIEELLHQGAVLKHEDLDRVLSGIIKAKGEATLVIMDIHATIGLKEANVNWNNIGDLENKRVIFSIKEKKEE